MLYILKLLCSLFLLNLVFAAPPAYNEPEHSYKELVAKVKKRVERNRRQLLTNDEEKKLDLENYAPLKIVEKSLEFGDRNGDMEINGTKEAEDGAHIQYFHKKDKGTVKTIVEEKKDDKMENVFYHLSYEKQHAEETTRDTTDQTLGDEDSAETTLGDFTTDMTLADEETTLPQRNDEYDEYKKLRQEGYMEDPTIPSEEKDDDDEENKNNNAYNIDNNVNNVDNNANNNDNNVNNENKNKNGWFSNWFNWLSRNPNNNGNNNQMDNNCDYYNGQNNNNDLNEATQNEAVLQSDAPQSPVVSSSTFTIFSPFYFGSISLKSPSCPPHRPNLLSVYFFSFCL